ncbi:MAG: hypothetical protein ACRDL8_09560, partial [Solirubrobacteraceae bacterium]
MARRPGERAVRLYTLLQLLEVCLFCAVLLIGVLTHRPSVAVFGGGLLLGKAVLNILAPEGGTVLRRSLVGYGLGAIFTLLGL